MGKGREKRRGEERRGALESWRRYLPWPSGRTYQTRASSEPHAGPAAAMASATHCRLAARICSKRAAGRRKACHIWKEA